MSVGRARGLRKRSTDAERTLWKLLRGRQLYNAKFRRQVSIGSYIVDFISYDHRLIIEADGGQHADNESDEVRTAWLQSQGFRVIRFWNNEILFNAEGVLRMIAEAIDPSPQTPLPQGERGLSAGASIPSPLGGEGGAHRVSDGRMRGI